MRLCVAIFVLLAFTLSALSLGSPARRVAVVHSYPPGEWFHAIQNELDDSSRALGLDFTFLPIVFHAEYWLRRPKAELGLERERILKRIDSMNAVAVILCDDEAADVFARPLSERGVGLFLTGINRDLEQTTWWKALEKRASVVLERYPVQQLLQSSRRVLPRARKLALFTSRNPSSEIILKQVIRDIDAMKTDFGRYPFEISDVVMSDRWQEWKALLPSAQRKADLVWLLVPYDVRDAHGAEVPLERIGKWMSRHLAVPSLGLSSVHPKMGVMMTVALSPRQLARATTQQLRDWSRSGRIGAVHTEKQGQLYINVETASRLGIKLPPDIFSVSKIVRELDLPYGR